MGKNEKKKNKKTRWSDKEEEIPRAAFQTKEVDIHRRTHVRKGNRESDGGMFHGPEITLRLHSTHLLHLVNNSTGQVMP